MGEEAGGGDYAYGFVECVGGAISSEIFIWVESQKVASLES